MIHSLGHVANFDCLVPVLSHLSWNSKQGNAFLLVYDLEHQHHSCQCCKLQNKLYSVQRSLIHSRKQKTEDSLYSGMQWIMWPLTAKLQPLVDIHVHCFCVLSLHQCGITLPMFGEVSDPCKDCRWFNPLSPKSDQHQISPCNTVAMLCKTECSWELRTSSH